MSAFQWASIPFWIVAVVLTSMASGALAYGTFEDRQNPYYVLAAGMCLSALIMGGVFAVIAAYLWTM